MGHTGGIDLWGLPGLQAISCMAQRKDTGTFPNCILLSCQGDTGRKDLGAPFIPECWRI